MDPASAIGVLGFGLHIVYRIHGMYGNAREAVPDVRALCASNSLLSECIDTVKSTIVRSGDSSQNTVSLVEQFILPCKESLERIDKKLDKVQRLSSMPSALHLQLRMRYAFQTMTITKLKKNTVDGELLNRLKLALAVLNL